MWRICSECRVSLQLQLLLQLAGERISACMKTPQTWQTFGRLSVSSLGAIASAGAVLVALLQLWFGDSIAGSDRGLEIYGSIVLLYVALINTFAAIARYSELRHSRPRTIKRALTNS